MLISELKRCFIRQKHKCILAEISHYSFNSTVTSLSVSMFKYLYVCKFQSLKTEIPVVATTKTIQWMDLLIFV